MTISKLKSFKTEEHCLAALLTGAARPDGLSTTECTRLVEIALEHGVAPMLYWQLRRIGVDLTTPAWAALNAEYQNQIRQYLRLKAEFEELAAALAAAGIPSICLKGFALAHTVYPNVTLRPMRDLDVLVPYPQRKQAVAQLKKLGFVQTIVRPSQTAQDLYHDYQLRRNVLVELHYRLLGVHSKFFTSEAMQWFWGQTTSVHRSGMTLTVLRPEAMLLHLCAHAILNHGEPEFRLQRYLDLHLLISNSPGLDWQLIVQHAVELRWTYAVKRALELTREYFATPIPATLLSGLAAVRPIDEDSTRSLHTETNATPVEIVLNYIRGMQNREKMQWLAAFIFPSLEYMRWRYPMRASWQIPLFYMFRWAVIIRNIFETLGNGLKAR